MVFSSIKSKYKLTGNRKKENTQVSVNLYFDLIEEVHACHSFHLFVNLWNQHVSGRTVPRLTEDEKGYDSYFFLYVLKIRSIDRPFHGTTKKWSCGRIGRRRRGLSIGSSWNSSRIEDWLKENKNMDPSSIILLFHYRSIERDHAIHPPFHHKSKYKMIGTRKIKTEIRSIILYRICWWLEDGLLWATIQKFNSVAYMSRHILAACQSRCRLSKASINWTLRRKMEKECRVQFIPGFDDARLRERVKRKRKEKICRVLYSIHFPVFLDFFSSTLLPISPH